MKLTEIFKEQIAIRKDGHKFFYILERFEKDETLKCPIKGDTDNIKCILDMKTLPEEEIEDFNKLEFIRMQGIFPVFHKKEI